MGIPLRNKQIVAEGSDNFTYTGLQMLTLTTRWINLLSQFPACRQYLPLDSCEIYNNSAQNVNIYVNDINDVVPIPAYMVKPISGRAIWRLGIYNAGAGTIAAGEIMIQFRRLSSGLIGVRNG